MGDQLPLESPLFPSEYASRFVNSLQPGGFDRILGHTSQGSDGDAFGDVFLWGQNTGDCGPHRVGNSVGAKTDSLLPKALESAVMLDVQKIACGGRHAALVTKQGEIFSWGNESGGRLGQGVDSDVLCPKIIESLSKTNIELVACGEYHMCAVTFSGELYTWGDGNFGILGHGNEVSHWVPKRVNGPLEGIHVSFISCGSFHTAVVTSAGQLFTFGDGTFGVLGHGDRKSILKPREVESLKGLQTVRAACGVWHTAAVVEVMAGNSSSRNCISGKLFTWGDGDKYRLGHGDKKTKLVPICVAALVGSNICQVTCGYDLTVALTTSGHVYTMGSPVLGQLGNPQADGELPTRVEGKLSKSFVEGISCGAYHVAVLTSRAEVYTWGKGSNGRLGHGDIDDRNSPTLVETLKDKQVKTIACGTNFTAAICLHKWVSGTDQSMCSGCHLPFNFKRKRHNCYNCGLVFCHSCSSKKLLRASMALNPNKPYRVCDNCANKLKKSIDADISSQSSVSRILPDGPLDRHDDQMVPHEEPDTNGQLKPNAINSCSSGYKKPPMSETVAIKSSRSKDSESQGADDEWVEQDEPGVYLTLTLLPGGAKDLKRVRFSRKRFNENQAEQWWAENRKRVYEQYDARSSSTLVEAIKDKQVKTIACDTDFTEAICLLNGQMVPYEEPDTNGSNRRKDSESQGADDEWKEQDEPGVYLTLTSLPGGAKDLKRVRFSRRRFSENQAEQWWAKNRKRVYEQCTVRNSPTPVKALKDKQVETIACDTDFIEAICFHHGQKVPYEESDINDSNRRKDTESQGADDE